MKKAFFTVLTATLLTASTSFFADQSVEHINFDSSTTKLLSVLTKDCLGQFLQVMHNSDVVSDANLSVSNEYPGIREVYNITTAVKDLETSELVDVSRLIIHRTFVSSQVPPYVGGSWVTSCEVLSAD